MIKHTSKRTKIIATIGPSSNSKEVMKELMLNGVNIFRFNMKHNEPSWHQEFIKQAREVASEINYNLGILIDLQGPEIRIKTLNADPISTDVGENIQLYTKYNEELNSKLHGSKVFFIPIPGIENGLDVGDKLVIDDGAVFLEIVEKNNDYFTVRSDTKSTIKNNKSLNIVDKDVNLPSLTDLDRNRLQVATKEKVDFVALSFVRQKSDVDTLQAELDKLNLSCKIISKIESKKGVENIVEIIDSCYGIMIARGDLGVETPIEGVTFIQKEIIKECKIRSKPVIVATQMLESMINSKFPTRAEAADVSNAVFDSTDAVMLSGETAFGANPIEVVKVMNKICSFNEFVVPDTFSDLINMDNSAHIAYATLGICKDSKINKIIALTETGYTPRVISSLRPRAEIIAVSDSQETINLLSMSRGVVGFKSNFKSSDLNSYDKIINELTQKGLLIKGEHVVAVHGKKLGEVGGTNSLMIVEI